LKLLFGIKMRIIILFEFYFKNKIMESIVLQQQNKIVGSGDSIYRKQIPETVRNGQ